MCLLVSLSAHAQETGKDTTTKFTPPVIVKDSVQRSENKKEEYKSKEWRQGNEAMNDTTKGSGEKAKSGMEKKTKRPQRPAPPPPPPELPPAPLPPHAKQ